MTQLAPLAVVMGRLLVVASLMETTVAAKVPRTRTVARVHAHGARRLRSGRMRWEAQGMPMVDARVGIPALRGRSKMGRTGRILLLPAAVAVAGREGSRQVLEVSIGGIAAAPIRATARRH